MRTFLCLGLLLVMQSTLVAQDENLLPCTKTFSPSDDVQYELQAALIDAVPGDVIHLKAGNYSFDKQLDIVCDNITIRGDGKDKTILSFRKQTSGDTGIHATGNAFVIEDLAVQDTIGNSIKVLGARDVTIRGVRVEWTDGPKTDNGAYGIYPVECENVLIENSEAIGASDAGIYVGQSDLVIVRGCVARQNVAGIEIENTTRADVYDNLAEDNTGGLLVFDLPGLKKERGNQVRVFDNRVIKNNHPNFASKGSIVSSVPPGTGVMLMTTDDVEIFENEVSENDTCGILIVSYLITERKIKNENYDPFPDSFSVHDNHITECGKQPRGYFGQLLSPLVGLPFPAIVFDGFVNPAAKQPRLISIRDNGEASFANLKLGDFSPQNVLLGKHKVDRDLEGYADEIPALPEISLQPHAEPTSNGNPAVAVYRAAPESLDEWGLYELVDGKWTTSSDWQEYELNTPLFSDYTIKHRFIRLPNGKKMQWNAVDSLDFPVGTVIAKTFAYPDPTQDATPAERVLETRIELLNESGWYGYSYIWNDEQSGAALHLGGGVLDVAWKDSSGKNHRMDYEIPNANQCITCHSRDGVYIPLGPTVRNLNRESADDPNANQLARWIAKDQLSKAPPEREWPRLADYADAKSGSLNDRARAWLEVNCAHCHNPTGSARTSGLDIRSVQTTAANIGVFKSPVAAGKGSGDRKYDIVPGRPDDSILLYRLETDEAGIRMPNIARAMVHEEAVAMIREWILEMPTEK